MKFKHEHMNWKEREGTPIEHLMNRNTGDVLRAVVIKGCVPVIQDASKIVKIRVLYQEMPS